MNLLCKIGVSMLVMRITNGGLEILLNMQYIILNRYLDRVVNTREYTTKYQ